jgi:hypothetical protein
MKLKFDEINDIFVISSSGIPFFSKCYGGPGCKNQPNHLLVSDFLAAVFQFSMQFGQRSIREIIFEEGQMVIDSSEIREQQLLTIIFASGQVETKDLRNLVSIMANAFQNNYSNLIEQAQYHPKMSDFKSFTQTLNEIGITQEKVMGDVPILKSCKFSFESTIKGYIYCRKQQKDLPFDEELQFQSQNPCPYVIS